MPGDDLVGGQRQIAGRHRDHLRSVAERLVVGRRRREVRRDDGAVSRRRVDGLVLHRVAADRRDDRRVQRQRGAVDCNRDRADELAQLAGRQLGDAVDGVDPGDGEDVADADGAARRRYRQDRAGLARARHRAGGEGAGGVLDHGLVREPHRAEGLVHGALVVLVADGAVRIEQASQRLDDVGLLDRVVDDLVVDHRGRVESQQRLGAEVGLRVRHQDVVVAVLVGDRVGDGRRRVAHDGGGYVARQVVHHRQQDAVREVVERQQQVGGREVDVDAVLGSHREHGLLLRRVLEGDGGTVTDDVVVRQPDAQLRADLGGGLAEFGVVLLVDILDEHVGVDKQLDRLASDHADRQEVVSHDEFLVLKLGLPFPGSGWAAPTTRD